MSKVSSIGAAQMIPGFDPNRAISTCSLRAIITLAAVRRKVMERVESSSIANALFYSTLLSPTTQEAASQAKAWTFSLGLTTVEGSQVKPVKLAEIAEEDTLSVEVVKDMVKELEAEGVLTELNVEITDVKKLDEYGISITINLKDQPANEDEGPIIDAAIPSSRYQMRGAAPLVQGFQPRPDVAVYPVRAMKTLAGLREKIMRRADESGIVPNLWLYSRLLDPLTESWIFSLGLRGIGDIPIKLAEIPDVLSIGAVKEMIIELGGEGALAEQNVSVTDVKQIDDFTISMSVNLKD